MAEERLDGGNLGGAVRAGDTVRRAAGPWTPAVHALLAHLATKGFTGAPRPLGFDEQGREVLTFLEGETVGSGKPWPAWAHADGTLDQVARWMRGYHRAVADFVPPPGAVWREGGAWSPGLIIGHNDAAPYNAAWHQGTLAGFFDWDFAGPVTPEWDLAFAAFSWVPLHARHIVVAEGFTDFAARPGGSASSSTPTAGRRRRHRSLRSSGPGSRPTLRGSAAMLPRGTRCSRGCSTRVSRTTLTGPSLSWPASQTQARPPASWPPSWLR